MLRLYETIANLVNLKIIYVLKEVAQLGEGKSFGELALENADSRRAATIKMKTESFLGYLDRTEYNMVMKNIIKRRAQLDIKFLKDNALFTNVPPRKLTLL